MADLDQITQRRDAARTKYDALRKKRLAMFSEGFFTIKMKLKEMYRMLTLGGDAELEQVCLCVRSCFCECVIGGTAWHGIHGSPGLGSRHCHEGVRHLLADSRCATRE